MKNILACFVFLCGALLTPASVFADDTAYENELARQWKLMPRTPKILRYPSTESWDVYGLDSTSDLKSSVGAIGGKALEVRVKSATPNPWDIGIQAANQVPVSKGDVVVAAFWGRASKLPNGKSSAAIPANLQLSTEPYTQIGNLNAKLTSNWRVFYLHGTASRNFEKGALNLALHAGGDRQTIELGPMFLWSLGPEI